MIAIILPAVVLSNICAQNIDSLRHEFKKTREHKKAEIGFRLAEAYIKKRNFDSAMFFIDNSVKEISSSQNTQISGNLYKLRGNIFLRKGQTHDAIQNYEQALAIYQKVKDFEGVEAVYNNLGLCYGILGESDKAIEYLEKSANQAQKNRNRVSEAKTLHNIGHYYEKLSLYDKALEYYLRALQLKEEYDPDNNSSTINNIGNIYFYTKYYDKALEYYERAYQLAVEKNSPDEIAIRLSNVGMVLKHLGRAKEAIEKMIESVTMYEGLKDYSNLGRVQTLIGSFLNDIGDLDRSLEYYKKALDNYAIVSDSIRIAQCYYNISNVLVLKEDYPKALEYLTKANHLFTKSKATREKVYTLNSMISIYHKLKQYDKALLFADSAIRLSQNQLDQHTQITSMLSKANILVKQNNLDEALRLAKKVEEFPPQFHNNVTRIDTYLLLKTALEKKGDYHKALEYSSKYSNFLDSINRIELKEKITEIERRYQLKEKEKEIAQLTSEAYETREKLRFRNYLLITSLIAVFLLLFSTYITHKAYKHKKQTSEQLATYNLQISQQSEEIRAQRDSMGEQMKIIQQQHQALTDSLNYAQTIQSAILPSSNELARLWKTYFVLYLPKDIVSGDFYWAAQIDNKIYAAAIDCTGHGVPGALTSIQAYNALQTAITNQNLKIPGEIIAFADQYLAATFQTEKEPHQPDKGMSLALCGFDRETLEMQFAGARQGAFIVRQKSATEVEIIELKGSPKSAGTEKNPKFVAFDTHTLTLTPNDTIYLYTDGYADQFDENNKKFKKSKLKENLIKYATFEPAMQQRLLANDFSTWKGQSSQTDDVLIIGIKI